VSTKMWTVMLCGTAAVFRERGFPGHG
jgi:hypothetical protein